MASVEEVDVNSPETGSARRGKNVVKRGRGRKRGASAVSTRSTRSKKPVPNFQDSEEEEDVEDTSQNEMECQDDPDGSVDTDTSSDVIKNGIEGTASPEVNKTETTCDEKNSGISQKQGADSDSTVESKDESRLESELSEKCADIAADKTASADEKTDSVADQTAVEEKKVIKSELKTLEEGEVAPAEITATAVDKVAVKVEDKLVVAKDKIDSENENVNVKKEVINIKEEVVTAEDVATTKSEVSTSKNEAATTKNLISTPKDVVATKVDVSSSEIKSAAAVKDKSAVVKKPAAVETKPAAKKPAATESKSAVRKPAVTEDKSAAPKDKLAVAEDKRTATKEKSAAAEDKPPVAVKEKPTATEEKPAAAEDTLPTASKEKPTTAKDKPAAPEDKPAAAKSRDVKNGSVVKDGATGVTVSSTNDTVASGKTKPLDTASVGSPMEVDISQYTVLEETNASQGSADEKVDEQLESDEAQVTYKKEREQSPEVGEMKNASMDDMTVIDEVEDEGDEKDEGAREGKTAVKSEVQLDDMEMVSEDELPTETAKEPETEAVSDEELPGEPTASGDLPETEEVSEDELPPEKTEKKKKDSEVETPVVSESVPDPAKKKKKGRFEAQKRKLADGDTYDPSSPTSENSCDETPSKRAALSSGSADKAKQSTKGRKALPELEKYWKAVKEDASDFTGWTYLLQYVDQENDIDAAREAYDAFLSHYPYCYGYWRKYADYEKRKGNKEKCEEVFDRGLKAIPLSVDLWIHYLHYCKTTYSDEEFLRVQFERALSACGMEFRSDRLWESFIKWETEGKRLQNVTAIYDRLLNMPTQGYTSHFENFQEHVSNNPPQKVLSVDEFLSLRREVLQLLKQYDSPGTEDAAPGEDVEAPPGEETEETPSVSDEETTALRERIVALRRKVHKATVAAVADRWNFEEGIKRPYFHVKPLERCQLKNWKDYLDFEIEKGDRERIITLFERCLIACALYEEFWLKFVRYLESEKGEDMVDKIRDVYERACTIHHPKKPNLHLHWSVFEESHKNYDRAAEILTNLEKAVPNLIQVSYRRINLERRRGNLDKVCSLYEHYISTSKNKVIANNMAIKYARFCWKVKNDVEKAISVLNKAMEKDKENPRLYLQLIDMGMQRQTLDETEIISTIDLFLSRDVDPEQKVLFAQRKVEFLEDFSSDIVSVQKSHDEFLRYCKQIKERKKKSAEDAKSESSAKKSKSASGDSASQHTSHTTQSHTAGQAAQPASSQGAAGQYATQNYSQSSYSQAPPAQGSYQSGQYAGSQPAGPYSQTPYNQQYSQSGDASYANYQNWGYSQPGYGGYNQGWGNYNYY